MRFIHLAALIILTVAVLALQAQPIDFGGLESARDATSDPASRLPTKGVDISGSFNETSVAAGSSMQFGMTDQRYQAGTRLPGGLTLIVSKSKATFRAGGVLPVTADAEVNADARADASGQLRIDSQQVVDDFLSQIDDVPGLPDGFDPGGYDFNVPDVTRNLQGHADGTFNGTGKIDNVRGSLEIGKETQGVLVGIPVKGVSFFAGAKKVEEYVVVAVQGFDYEYSYDAEASGSVTDVDTGETRTSGRSHSGGNKGTINTPGLKSRVSMEYTVAVVGIGYRGKSGGFHVLADLAWSAPKFDAQGYVDVGPLKQLELPGPLRDVDVGGDFRIRGFTAGANVKLFTFAGYAAGAEVTTFMSQEFKSVSIGLSYQGKVRGLMANQNAAIEVAFKPTDNTRLTVIGGVRVLSSYMPELNSSTSRSMNRDISGDFGGHENLGGYGELDYSGTYQGSGTGTANAHIKEREKWTHEIQYAPGLRLDLLSSGWSIEGGPILNEKGDGIGGRGGAAYRINDQVEFGAAVHKAGESRGGMLHLGVNF